VIINQPLEYLKELQADKFWGDVNLVFQDGHITLIKILECFKTSDSNSIQRSSTSNHDRNNFGSR
jgi:hypothetical protein